MSHVNDQPVNDLSDNPFGGEKNSGIGRFGGAWAVEALATKQHKSEKNAGGVPERTRAAGH